MPPVKNDEPRWIGQIRKRKIGWTIRVVTAPEYEGIGLEESPYGWRLRQSAAIRAAVKRRRKKNIGTDEIWETVP